ncbi:MAG: 1-deoxy-D-xylulose-5-phosphate reductoisomerase [bacterium]
MKRVAVLGSTGTIGLNALDVVRSNPDRIKISLLVANKSWKKIKEQIEEFKPERVVLTDYDSYLSLKGEHFSAKTVVEFGLDAVKEALHLYKNDIILSAFSGTAGILPTYWAVENGSFVALANKESLVSAGELIMPLAERTKAFIVPVDSEHSALFQLLEGKDIKDVKKVILPASGGPFLNHSKKDMDKVEIQDALNHPVWKMGKKITVDSASLANKGLEVIEAHYLFGVPYDNIDVVIHPQCLIHGVVEMKDGAFFAHISEPDMRYPIAYALFYPERRAYKNGSFSSLVSSISIFDVDHNKFPLLNLAYEVGRMGKSYPAVFNIADEVAVNAFINGEIAFKDIYTVVSKAIESHSPNPIKSIDDIREIEKEVTDFMEKIIKKGKKHNG